MARSDRVKLAETAHHLMHLVEEQRRINELLERLLRAVEQER
ncbi:hypothetical protein [Muricoccus radiodurans]